jgi:(p)ppGpp synthase/HD superfamily hydrolase
LALSGNSAAPQQSTPPLTEITAIAKRTAQRTFSNRFIQALSYAARLHARQFRKGTQRPYVGHLLSVTSIVIEYGGDEEMAIAALLHDAVEDQGGLPRLREIRKKFGKRVAHIVDGCTDSYTEPKPPWMERKRAYVKRAASEAPEVRLVSAADKLSNAREALYEFRVHGDAVFERFAGKKEGTLWYYRALVNEFRKAGRNPLVEELDRVVTELESLSSPAHHR